MYEFIMSYNIIMSHKAYNMKHVTLRATGKFLYAR